MQGWRWWRWTAGLIATLLAIVAGPAFACDVAASSSANLGSYSPAALQASAVPYLRASSGFGCDSTQLVTLLSGNYLRATVASGAVLKLTSTTSSDTVAYRLAADSGGTVALTPGTQVTYMQNTVLNVAGLLGSNLANVPVYAKPATTSPVAAGTYTGSVAIRWDWSFCKGVSAANLCVLGYDGGSKTGTVTLTLTVAAKPALVTITTSTTWDPVDASRAPKSIPGSRGRLAVTIVNPDLVPLDLNSLAVALPTPPRLAIALDGDGTGAGTVIQATDGTPASGLTLTYSGPTSTTDDVDFSADNGASWSFMPVVGDAVTQAQVTQTRLRPKGSMAAGSSFSISVPYSVR